jgi:hypothetical protein
LSDYFYLWKRENQALLEIIGRLTVELSAEKKKTVGF